MRIDLHAHFYPPDLVDALARSGGPQMHARHPRDLADRIPVLDAAGIDRQILSVGALMPYVADASAGQAAARVFNDIHAAAIAPVPDRFDAFATLPLPHIEHALEEVDRSLEDLGFAGIALGSGADGKHIDHEYFTPLWEKLQARRAVVYFHPGVNNQSVLDGVDYPPWLLNPSFGSPGETGRTVARLVLAGILDRYPDVTIVAANSGGLLPHEWPHLTRAAAMTGHGHLAEGLRRIWFDCGTATEASLMAVRDSFGLDRLVLGTDAPYGDAVATVSLVQHSTVLSTDDTRRILDESPLRVLGLTKG